MTYADPVEEQFVSGVYYDRAGSSYYLSREKLESDYAPVRFERELRLFLKYAQNGSVLDVGCSSGAFLFQLKQRFPNAFRLLGMDASGPPLDYAESRGIPVCRGDFLEHDFGEASFDAVTFWAVLEHLPDPKSFLAKAISILKPGGYALVLVPNMSSLAVRILQSRHSRLRGDA